MLDLGGSGSHRRQPSLESMLWAMAAWLPMIELVDYLLNLLLSKVLLLIHSISMLTYAYSVSDNKYIRMLYLSVAHIQIVGFL